MGGRTAASEPAWSPDGDWLVISGTDAQNGRRSLYFLRRLPQTGSHAPPRSAFGWSVIRQASEPVWSPDGRDIAFTATGDDGPKIQIVRAQRYGPGSITAGRPKTLLDGASSFSWSERRCPDRLRRLRHAPREHRARRKRHRRPGDRGRSEREPLVVARWRLDRLRRPVERADRGMPTYDQRCRGQARYLDVGACMQGVGGCRHPPGDDGV